MNDSLHRNCRRDCPGHDNAMDRAGACRAIVGAPCIRIFMGGFGGFDYVELDRLAFYNDLFEILFDKSSFVTRRAEIDQLLSCGSLLNGL